MINHHFRFNHHFSWVFSFQPFFSTSVLHPHHSPNGLNTQALPLSPKGESSRSQPAAGRYDGSSTRSTVTGWYTYPSEKSWSEHQLGWHDIPNIWKIKIQVPNHQPGYIHTYTHVYVCVCVTWIWIYLLLVEFRCKKNLHCEIWPVYQVLSRWAISWIPTLLPSYVKALSRMLERA